MNSLLQVLLITFCMCLSTGAHASGHQQTESTTDPVFIESTITGSYACNFMSKNETCGGTDWILTIQSDGSRNLRAFQPRPTAQSQMNGFWRLDKDFRPLEAFINITNNGVLLGSALYTIQDGTMTANVSTPKGLTTEVVEVPNDFSFLLHPIPADGWHFTTYDFEKGGVQIKPICVLGAAGPSPLCKIIDFKLEFLGDETITVTAGTFETKHFKFGDAADIWFTADTDRHVIRHEFTGLDTRYELTSIQGR